MRGYTADTSWTLPAVSRPAILNVFPTLRGNFPLSPSGIVMLKNTINSALLASLYTRYCALFASDNSWGDSVPGACASFASNCVCESNTAEEFDASGNDGLQTGAGSHHPPAPVALFGVGVKNGSCGLWPCGWPCCIRGVLLAP